MDQQLQRKIYLLTFMLLFASLLYFGADPSITGNVSSSVCSHYMEKWGSETWFSSWGWFNRNCANYFVDNVCGDNILDPGEQCDTTSLSNCRILGFSSGTMACTSACVYDTSACISDGGTIPPASCEDIASELESCQASYSTTLNELDNVSAELDSCRVNLTECMDDSSPDICADESLPVYSYSDFGPVICCNLESGIKPNSFPSDNSCIAPIDGSIGTCIFSWNITCGDGDCNLAQDEDFCSCPDDCQPPCLYDEDCPEGYYCNEGDCIVFEHDILCSDSDEGIDYYVKGTATNSTETKEDSCINDLLTEYFCLSESIIGYEEYECLFGCYDGACLYDNDYDDDDDDYDDDDDDDEGYDEDGDPIGIACIDYDDGINLYVGSNATLSDGTFSLDSCVTGKWLSEAYCNNSMIENTVVMCPDTCIDNRCVNETSECFDSDGGIVFDVYGYTTESNSTVNHDYCLDDQFLVEFYCNEENRSSSTIYSCPDTCSEGECLLLIE
jgi:hypothetical protein